jgi:hypothetical protein
MASPARQEKSRSTLKQTKYHREHDANRNCNRQNAERLQQFGHGSPGAKEISGEGYGEIIAVGNELIAPVPGCSPRSGRPPTRRGFLMYYSYTLRAHDRPGEDSSGDAPREQRTSFFMEISNVGTLFSWLATVALLMPRRDPIYCSRDFAFKQGWTVVFTHVRHWLEYDAVALAALLIGIGVVTLIVLSV